jgi:hypothetical protein
VIGQPADEFGFLASTSASDVSKSTDIHVYLDLGAMAMNSHQGTEALNTRFKARAER